MAAEDHLSGQFEVLRKHRMVRIGERTYPAVFTSTREETGVRHAVIPMENGSLISVSHYGNEPSADINAPYMQTAGKQSDRDEIMAKGNQDLYGQIGSAWGVQDLHRSLDALSKVKLHPQAVQNNARMMGVMKRVFHDEDD